MGQARILRLERRHLGVKDYDNGNQIYAAFIMINFIERRT